PERQAVQNAENTPQPAAHDPSTCVASTLTLLNGIRTPATAALLVFGPQVLTFSTEVVTLGTATVNLDYSINGGAPRPIGPEFFARSSPPFVPPTALGATTPPFVPPPLVGLNVIQPVLTGLNPALPVGTPVATVEFRCFNAAPISPI